MLAERVNSAEWQCSSGASGLLESRRCPSRLDAATIQDFCIEWI